MFRTPAIDVVYGAGMAALDDLNLLRPLVSIVETGNLTRSAAQLGVTQPTLSHALARLRRRFDDPLFVRGPAGMVPTDLARDLYSTLKPALTDIEQAVAGAARFDPATTTRLFRLCLTDLGELALLPRILDHVGRRAPHVSVEVVPMDIGAVEGWLRSGRVDAAIASTPLDPRFATTTLLREHYVCLLAEHHPLAAAPALTLDDFTAARHAVVTTTTGHQLAERAIRELGIVRRTTVTLPHFAALPHILERADLLAVVPAGLAQAFTGRWPLTIRPLPFDVPPFQVRLFWQRHDREPAATAWFHRTIAEAVGDAGVGTA